MVPGNQTQFTEFILLGFSEKAEQQGLLFGLFLGMYLVTVVGNLLIMLAIGSDSHLHTPMYFFLSNLSFVDICVVSTTVPKMLVSILTQNKAISYADCLAQMSFFMVFAGLDNFLLTAMAYDRFVAICHPLRYAAIMSPQLCSLLVLLSWMISFLDSLLHSLMVTRLSFFGPMVPGNQTQFTEFILLGFSEKPEEKGPLFGLFLVMYLVTVVGNLLIMLAIGSDSHLHTPMYFFLSNLSFVDICVVSTTVPKMLVSILTQNKAISYADCLAQMYFFLVFAGLDDFLLSAMAYDRFVAICHPLRYAAIMSPGVCCLLVLFSWIISLLYSLLHSLMVTRLSFCTDHEIQHFFCDLPQVLKLACSDTLINYVLVYLVAGLLGILPLTGILFSYSQICSSILKVPSAQGKYKAFSTCGSHLTVVCLFYGTGLGVYLSSSGTHSSWKSTVASAMYAVVTPMLNPFIYTLRNKDIKYALKRLMSRIPSSQ
ncbi:olfactory receptor 7D4-like isoform X1 [Dromiciops gliroides]|uniref:olfactory receptor 7D4-like isoform X1 n=1 Tax=Dromiciops gliroides TaxID=33562 RepID=UPI001CC78A8D|nr:olfactory receptor 7D4-like isoform X1 [Dromiciops gliroides]